MSISQEALDDLARRGAAQGVDPAPGLALVERHLRTRVASDLPFVEDAARYLIDAGGKRFRPMLLLLTGMLGGKEPVSPDLVSAGVIVELVHLSTLYHDDVIDAAEVRRGTPAAHVKWSNTVAILTGDFLLARASELSAELGVEVTRLMARTIADLCQGQIREVQGSQLGERHGAAGTDGDRQHYLRVVEEKTASLISASTRLGAMLAGMPPPAVEALTAYGRALGMAFQLSDDILDIMGDPSDSGKVPGTDLREGVRTLPTLLALERDGLGSQLARLLGAAADGEDAGVVGEALALLRAHPALPLARDAARFEADRAKQVLRHIARTPETIVVLDGLDALADYAVSRVG
ncbi:MAG: polyprenyl synthetase family protein [Nitriliruptorales bacterium]|nr:polyprenyl synthetase family protein [Nitriliruptorales bacterium]